MLADRDDRVAAGDDGEVAGGPDGGRDDVRTVRVGFLDRDPGQDPDRLAAGLLRPARHRLHHAATAAADDGDARLGEPAAHLLRQLR